MRTKAYTTPAPRPSGKPRRPASEKSDAASRRIRAALIASGSSLRLWAHAWAECQGRDPQGAYDLLRMTIARRLERGLAPRGPVGRAMIEALRADLGADVVPLPATELERAA